MENCFDKIYNLFLANKMGHAFLIETNNIDQAVKEIMELSKKINCPQNFQKDCSNDCEICFQIDNFCLPSIKYIEPIGQAIKKEQIIDLKNKFVNNSMITKYNIYIIKNAEKLNSSSANVLLKFLEDPGTETIGFFILNNKKNIISTIKSRCQIYSYNINNDDDQISQLKEIFKEIIPNIFSNLLKEKSLSFLKNKEIILQSLKEKKEQELFLNYIFSLIAEETNNRIKGKETNNKAFSEFSIKVLVNFMQITKEIIEKLQYNVNIELLLDDYFIKMGELI